MTDLEAAIRERLALDDDSHYFRYDCEMIQGAVFAVLELHQKTDDGTDDTGKRYHRCSCGYAYYPCPTLLALAKGLGIEVAA